MTKSELIQSVAKASGLTGAQAKLAVNACFDVIADELGKGGKVVVTGFGNFEVTERAGRMGRNPSTGEAMKIQASKNVRFKAGRTLKEAVNG